MEAESLFYFMAKRFTDTEKWKKPFIRSLKAPYKLLWLYICDDCDHSGIWQVDMEVAEIRIGEKLNEQKAIEYFAEKIILLDNGSKWFIPSFVEFQYPSGLSENNKAHAGIIKNLDKYKNQIENFKPLTRPLQGDKDMDMDKVMDMVKVKEKVIVEILDPKFEEWWLWYDYKVSKEKAKKSWNKLNENEKDLALQSVQAYVQSTPDKTYRKHPTTYLNQKCFNDEIINRNTTSQSRIAPKVTPEQLYEAHSKFFSERR